MQESTCSVCVQEVTPTKDGSCPHCGEPLSTKRVSETANTVLCPTGEQLSAFASQHLPEREREEISRHIMSCLKCANFLDATNSPTVELRHRPYVSGVAGAELPAKIGDYEIESILGQGGFGVVHKAKTPGTGESVAVKVLKSRQSRSGGLPSQSLSPTQRKTRENLFKKEGEALLSLQHPNIVPVYHVETDTDPPYIVSKFIESNLQQRMQQDLSSEESADIVALVARGLHEAHTKGLVHRDIKPENILLDEIDFPYIADFGLVLSDDQYGMDAVQAGTPAYMSPEQAEGKGELADARSDIFSLGVVFYELLTKKRPFVGKDKYEVLDRVRTLDPRRPQSLRDDIPIELEKICLRAMAKRPEDRFPSAIAMAETLDMAGASTVRRRISANAFEWNRNGEDQRLFARGPQLDAFVQWQAKNPAKLSEVEIRFLDVSASAQRLRLNRIRKLAIAIGLVVVGLLAAAAIQWNTNRTERQARQEERTIEQDAKITEQTKARILKLIDDSRIALRQGKPQRSALLSKEALQLAIGSSQDVQFQAKESLRDALGQLGGQPFASDASAFALASNGIAATAYNDRNGSVIRVWIGNSWLPEKTVESKTTALALDANGRQLAVANEKSIELWTVKETGISRSGTHTAGLIHWVGFQGSKIITLERCDDGWHFKLGRSDAGEKSISDTYQTLPHSVQLNRSENALGFIERGKLHVLNIDADGFESASKQANIDCFCFGSNEGIVYFSGGSRLYELTIATGEKSLLRQLPTLTDPITAMTCSDQNELSLVASDKWIAITRDSVKFERQISGHDRPITSIHNAMGITYTWSEDDLTIRAWDSPALQMTSFHANCAAFNLRGDLLAIGLSQRPLHADSEVISVPFALNTNDFKVRQSPSGKWIAILQHGYVATVIDLERPNDPDAIEFEFDSELEDYAISNTARVVGVSEDGFGNRHGMVFPGSCVAWSPNSLQIAIGSLDYDHVRLRNIESDDEIDSQLKSRETAQLIRYSQDGKRIAAFCGDHYLRVWNAGDVDPFCRLACDDPLMPITSLLFVGSDNNQIVAADELGNIAIWDIHIPQKPMFSLVEGDSPIRHLCSSPDGAYLAISRNDGKMQIFPLSADAFLTTADAKIGREPNLSEREDYGL